MSEAKVEQQSTETLSFCCWCERCRLTRGRRVKQKRVAFTLAEVLITLGIIGVVAALTLPALIQNYQQKVLQVQFKKFYTTFTNAIKYVQATNGAPVACYYWEKSPYSGAQCTRYNEYGTCTGWAMADGSPLSADYNGNIGDCVKFGEDLMKALKTVKYCPNNALKNGCITAQHRGIDKANAEMHPGVEYDPTHNFSDSNLKNLFPAFVTADGTIIVRYVSWSANPFFWVDINGTKGPNKYGYDVFSFGLRGTSTDGITKIFSQGEITEKGGTRFNELLKK